MSLINQAILMTKKAFKERPPKKTHPKENAGHREIVEFTSIHLIEEGGKTVL